MLISIDELKELNDFKNVPYKTLERKIKAIETTIRKYTNNNFQNRLKRITAPSSNGILLGSSEYVKLGDTIEITESINTGLFTIKEISDNGIVFEEPLYNADHNFCTKVEYPLDVIEGALNLLKWELDESNKSKQGVSSETISRHSVTYKNLDDKNTINGYPVELFNFCKDYMKARF